MSKGGLITRVYPGSLAEDIGLVPGDKIIAVNDEKLTDIIDLSFAMSDEDIEMLIEHEDGEQEIIAFEKDFDEQLGVEFQNAVFGLIRQCCNNCYFCFVDQIAPNMRDSLSVKDDDYRLSFLYGNFITMTNMGPNDWSRIRRLHLSPLYASVHTTNPQLRAQMLRTPRAEKIMEQLEEMRKAEIDFHTQIVLCPGLNDKAELDRTITDLATFRPYVQSIGIVPVGLTQFRDNCYPLTKFTQDSARATIAQVEAWQHKFKEELGTSFVFLSDEFYLVAGYEVPPAEHYEGYRQLDNGIGLTRNFMEQFREQGQDSAGYPEVFNVDIITGSSVGPVFAQLIEELAIPNLYPKVRALQNDFFGHEITVSGLLTGKDIIKNLQITAKERRRHGIILPGCSLRTGEDIFLDDITLEQVQAQFPDTEIKVVNDGADLRAVLEDWYHTPCVRSKAQYTWQSNAAYTKPSGFEN